jgi:hypothetical protein
MTYVLKITKPTYDVLTETDARNFIFNSDLNHLKTYGSINFQRTVTAGNSTIVTVAHGLGYKPLVLAYFRSTANSNWFITMTQVEATSSRLGLNCNVELYVDSTYVYFKINNYDASATFTIEVKAEVFFEGS